MSTQLNVPTVDLDKAQDWAQSTTAALKDTADTTHTAVPKDNDSNAK
jgi:hypothetical protein